MGKPEVKEAPTCIHATRLQRRSSRKQGKPLATLTAASATSSLQLRPDAGRAGIALTGSTNGTATRP